MDNNTVCQLNLLEPYLNEAEASAVLKVSGDLCYESQVDVAAMVRERLSQKPECVVLDLAEVGMVDSSGIRCLLQASKACEEAGATLRIGTATSCVLRIIDMSGLSALFGVPPVWSAGTPAAPTAAAVPLPDASADLSSAAMLESRDSQHASWHVSEFVAKSDPYVISVLRDKATRTAIEAGAAGDVLCDIQIAVGEALTNAYRHGSPDPQVNRIILRCMTCPGGVAFEIQDEGHPFDADAVPEPRFGLLPEHGMGIHLMRHAMDAVEFRSDCPGNLVRMVKWIPQQLPS